MRRSSIALLCTAAALAGCGDEPAPREADEPPRSERPPTPRIEPIPCADGQPNCRSATGSVLYLESVDPDGDGDLHVVLASRQSVSGPGITIVDVKPALRPRRDPRPGDLVTAAGPVYRGSYGQRQIEATAARFRRR